MSSREIVLDTIPSELVLRVPWRPDPSGAWRPDPEEPPNCEAARRVHDSEI